MRRILISISCVCVCVFVCVRVCLCIGVPVCICVCVSVYVVYVSVAFIYAGLGGGFFPLSLEFMVEHILPSCFGFCGFAFHTHLRHGSESCGYVLSWSLSTTFLLFFFIFIGPSLFLN